MSVYNALPRNAPVFGAGGVPWDLPQKDNFRFELFKVLNGVGQHKGEDAQPNVLLQADPEVQHPELSVDTDKLEGVWKGHRECPTVLDTIQTAVPGKQFFQNIKQQGEEGEAGHAIQS